MKAHEGINRRDWLGARSASSALAAFGTCAAEKDAATGHGVELLFSERVRVKGAPGLAMSDGGMAAHVGDSGTTTLRFAKGPDRPAMLEFAQGVIIASEAAGPCVIASTPRAYRKPSS